MSAESMKQSKFSMMNLEKVIGIWNLIQEVTQCELFSRQEKK